MGRQSLRRAGKCFVWFLIFAAILIANVQPASALGANGRHQRTGAPPQQGEVIISPLVKVLDREALSLLRAVNDDGTYIFAGHTPTLDALTIGDIMIGTQSDRMPFGFQRKVVDIVFDGAQILVRTKQATLEDSIIQAEFGVEQALTPENVFGAEPLPGVQLVSRIPRAAPNGFSISLNNVSLTTGVVANGYINLKPSLFFNAKISASHVTDLTFFVNTDEEAKLEISSTVNLLSDVLPEPVEIAKYTFKPITVMVGPLPVLFTPVLTVYVGMDGKVSASVTTGVTQQAMITSGVEYHGGAWSGISPVAGFKPQALNFYGPTFKAQCQLKAFVRPQFKLMIYSVVGPTASVDGFLELDIDPSSLDWWLYDGVKIKVGVKVEVISHVLAEYSNTVYEQKWFLDGSAPPPPTVPTTPTPGGPHSGGGWPWWIWVIILIVLLSLFLALRKR